MSRHGLPSAVRKPTRMTAEEVAQGSLGVPHATSDLRTYRCFLSRTMRGICGVLDTLAHATRGLLRKQCAVASGYTPVMGRGKPEHEPRTRTARRHARL